MGDEIFFERRPVMLNRWDPLTQTLTTTELPSGDVIHASRQLEDGSLAILTFNLGVPRDFLFVYEPSGELRCSLETDNSLHLPQNSIIISKERSAGLETTAERVFSIDPTTCMETDQVPDLTRFGRTSGSGDGELLIISEPVSETESRLVRYEYGVDSGWTEVRVGTPVPTRGRPQIGTDAIWAVGRTDLYRFSIDTLELEGQWPISDERSLSWTIENDQIWIQSSVPARLSNLDIATGTLEHFPLPFEVSSAVNPLADGLLIGSPSAGYLFDYEQRRFERLPDWFLLEAQDAVRWIGAPGS